MTTSNLAQTADLQSNLYLAPEPSRQSALEFLPDLKRKRLSADEVHRALVAQEVLKLDEEPCAVRKQIVKWLETMPPIRASDQSGLFGVARLSWMLRQAQSSQLEHVKKINQVLSSTKFHASFKATFGVMALVERCHPRVAPKTQASLEDMLQTARTTRALLQAAGAVGKAMKQLDEAIAALVRAPSDEPLDVACVDLGVAATAAVEPIVQRLERAQRRLLPKVKKFVRAANHQRRRTRTLSTKARAELDASIVSQLQ